MIVEGDGWRKGAARWIPVGIALGLIALATLVPVAEGPGGRRIPFWCLACGALGGADVVANVALFLPLGWAIALAGVRPRRGLVLVLAATIGVEALQYAIIPGRTATLSDLVTDSIGGLAGMALPGVVRWVGATAQRTLRAAALYGVLLAVTIAAGAALQATPPPRALYWTDGSPDGRPDYYTAFTGSVRVVRVNGSPLARSDGGEVPRSGGLEITVEMLSGRPDQTPAEILWLGDSSARGWAWMDQYDRDLHLHVVSASDRFGLRGHSPVLPTALPAAPGETAAVRMIVRRFAYRVAVWTTGGEVVREATVSPGDGWQLFTPFERARERWDPLLTGLWVAALLGPLGYLSAVRSGAAATAAAGVGAYFLALPIVLGCAWLPLAGWCGAAGGFLVGWRARQHPAAAEHA